MNLKTLLAVAALATVWTAGAQGSPALPLLPNLFLNGGSVYCKASYDSGLLDPIRFLCYGDYNLAELGPVRTSFGVRFDILPVVRTTPMLMFDYTADDWFAGLETGASFEIDNQQLGWYVGTTFGIRLPAAGGGP